MRGRSGGGGRSRGTSRRFGRTARQGDLDAAANSARPCSTGPMTAARSDTVHDDGARRPSAPIRIGISSCLLGEAVRFDGGHKRDAFLTETFGRSWSGCRSAPKWNAASARRGNRCGWCASSDGVRLLTVKTAVDLTDRMTAYARRARRAARRARICAATCSRRTRRAAAWSASRSTARGGVPDEVRPRIVRRGARRARVRTCRSRRKGACRIRGCARTSSSGCSRTGRLRGAVRRPLESGRARALSHRAQADADGAFARGLPAAGAAGGPGAGRCRARPRDAATPRRSWRR